MNLDPKISETIKCHHTSRVVRCVSHDGSQLYFTSFFSPASAPHFVVGLEYSPNLTLMTWFDLEDIDLGQ